MLVWLTALALEKQFHAAEKSATPFEDCTHVSPPWWSTSLTQCVHESLATPGTILPRHPRT